MFMELCESIFKKESFQNMATVFWSIKLVCFDANSYNSYRVKSFIACAFYKKTLLLLIFLFEKYYQV